MPGRHINDQQVRIYMRLRIDHMQATAAAKAGISVATARRIEHDPRPPSTRREARLYRTRPDPLAGHWDEVVVPLLQAAPGLRPVTILGELARRYPEQIGPFVRRTLERRIAAWKALHGPARDVIFPQVQEPGRMGLSDFTDASGLGVTIAGVVLEHRLYHFALAHSGFEHAEIVLGGESYRALAHGLENALRLLGGAPREHRSDSLSAAFRNLAKPDALDLTRRYQALVLHYRMTAARNNRGVAHENGAIESRHGHAKARIAQALLLRGSSAFDRLDDYRTFVAEVIAQHNRRHAATIDAERAALRPLPPAPAMTWEEMTVRVTTASGFTCRHVFYSVPSCLIGHRLRLRIHDEHIEAYLGGTFLLALPRGRRAKGGRAVHVVDYRHVGDVGQPGPVRRRCSELPCQQVGRQRQGMVAVGRGPEPPPAPSAEAVPPHQARNPVSPHPAPLGAQDSMHARVAIAAPAVGVDTADGVDQRPVAAGTGAFGPAPPCVVAAGTDLQHRTHHPHQERGPVILDEAEPHLGGPEKMPMAFFKMSRSICARSSSFCRRRISACSGDGVGVVAPARAGTDADPATVLGRPRQARSIEG